MCALMHAACAALQIRTCFRPSDDAATFPFNIPSNAYAVVELRALVGLLNRVNRSDLSARATSLANVCFTLLCGPLVTCSYLNSCFLGAQAVDKAIQTFGIMNHPVLGKVYAYEVDGFGNQFFMVHLGGLPSTT